MKRRAKIFPHKPVYPVSKKKGGYPKLTKRDIDKSGSSETVTVKDFDDLNKSADDHTPKPDTSSKEFVTPNFDN